MRPAMWSGTTSKYTWAFCAAWIKRSVRSNTLGHLTDQTNLVTRKLLSAETNLDALYAGLQQDLPDASQ
eukprot:7277879-Prorocentrum_lima.AAC.1